MVDLSVVEALGAAKERVEKGWCRGTLRNNVGDVCSLGALYYTTDYFTRVKASRFLVESMYRWEINPQFRESAIVGWNDNDGRRKEEVVCAFAKAIDLAIKDAYKGKV